MSWRTLEPEEGDGEIRRRLLSPLERVTLRELAARWTTYSITFQLEGLGTLVSDPALPGRLRGAFGGALLAGASDAARAGSPCTFDPPSAFEALFRKQGRLTPGMDLASPWVLGVDAHRSDLVISLQLFGFALDWAPAAMEAMTRAVRDLVEWPRDKNAKRPQVHIKRRAAEASTGDLPSVAADVVELVLLSPLVVSGHDPREHPEQLITGLGARLSGLARWHDLAIDERTDWRAIKANAGELDYRFFDVQKISWARRSGRQQRVIPMHGLIGRIAISGDISPDTLLLLRLGSTCHMGADVALGCGRYGIGGGMTAPAGQRFERRGTS